MAESVQAEVLRQMGRQPVPVVQFEHIPDRPYNDMRYLIDYGKATRELGWTPAIPFDQGKNIINAM